MTKTKNSRRGVKYKDDVLFLGPNHDGDERAYDWLEQGPKTSSELRDFINDKSLKWLGALAADYYNAPFATNELILEYSLLNRTQKDETVPWRIKAQGCFESGKMACRLMDDEKYEEALIWVASHTHQLLAAKSDLDAYSSMLEEARVDKSNQRRQEALETKKQFAAQKVNEYFQQWASGNKQLPSKTEFRKYLKKEYKNQIPDKDETEKIIARAAKKRSIKLPRFGRALC